MIVEKRLIMSNEDVEIIYKLRDDLEILLLNEDEFIGREEAEDLYNALYRFVGDIPEDWA